jgi:hypothetical protein
MKSPICSGALALMLLSLPAMAQDTTVHPHQLAVQQRPPLQLTDQERTLVQQGLATQDTQQKTPKNFEAKLGEPIPLTMTVDVMPPELVQQDPALQKFGYAKLADQVLVLDPMKKTIVAIIPRASPATGKEPTSVEWAATRGRELTGLPPETKGAGIAPAMEPAGDSGDKSNGNEHHAKER